jgi:hypothetical protein
VIFCPVEAKALCDKIKNPNINVDLPRPEKLDFRNKRFNHDIYFKDKSFRLLQCNMKDRSRIQQS